MRLNLVDTSSPFHMRMETDPVYRMFSFSVLGDGQSPKTQHSKRSEPSCPLEVTRNIVLSNFIYFTFSSFASSGILHAISFIVLYSHAVRHQTLQQCSIKEERWASLIWMIHHFMRMVVVVFYISLPSLFMEDAPALPGRFKFVCYCPLKFKREIFCIYHHHLWIWGINSTEINLCIYSIPSLQSHTLPRMCKLIGLKNFGRVALIILKY
jgi:hypothetical protein